MDAAGTVASIDPDTRAVAACPSCATQMRRYVHQYASGVWVDACDTHGVWLDDGELERLEAYAEANARGMSPTDATRTGNQDVGVKRPPIVTSPDAPMFPRRDRMHDPLWDFDFLPFE